MELTQQEIDRLLAIEKAAQVVSDRICVFYPIGDFVNDLAESLKPVKPVIDWSTLPVGTKIVFNHGVICEKAYFIRVEDNNGEIIEAINDSSLRSFYHKDYCTVEPKLYTELVKHDWPVDGKQPEWVKNNDRVKTESCNYMLAHNIDWEKSTSKWFAVVKS